MVSFIFINFISLKYCHDGTIEDLTLIYRCHKRALKIVFYYFCPEVYKNSRKNGAYFVMIYWKNKLTL